MSESTQEVGPGDASLLLQFLAVHEVSCPACRYNLKGLTRPACPECGEPVCLAVVSHGSSRGYEAGLLGLTYAAGLSMLIAIANVYGRPILSMGALLGTIWLGRRSWRWWRQRTGFIALPDHKKQERVALCWVPVVIGVVVLLAFR